VHCISNGRLWWWFIPLCSARIKGSCAANCHFCQSCQFLRAAICEMATVLYLISLVLCTVFPGTISHRNSIFKNFSSSFSDTATQRLGLENSSDTRRTVAIHPSEIWWKIFGTSTPFFQRKVRGPTASPPLYHLRLLQITRTTCWKAAIWQLLAVLCYGQIRPFLAASLGLLCSRWRSSPKKSQNPNSKISKKAAFAAQADF